MGSAYNTGMPLSGLLFVQRKKLGLTQKQCAAKFGVDQSQWSNWEGGHKTVPPEHFKALAEFLDEPESRIPNLVYGILDDALEQRVSQLEDAVLELREVWTAIATAIELDVPVSSVPLPGSPKQ